MPFHSSRAAHALSAALLLSSMFMSGCGPQFFNASGTVNSDGGLLKTWARTPIGCMRGDESEPGKILTFQFNLPPGFVAAHPGGKNAPEELQIAQSGKGVIGSIKMMALVQDPSQPNTFNTQPTDGFVLDSSSCKTITLDREEQRKSFAESRKPLRGHLQLDCTVQGSHLTADMTFKHCGM